MNTSAEPVRMLVTETGRTGVGAVFGIAERAGGRFHITQLSARGGRLLGRYRKRHLGAGEEAYEIGGSRACSSRARRGSAWAEPYDNQ